MDDRIDAALRRALEDQTEDRCPPGLRQAMTYAIFPGGGRLRPRVTLAVADLCDDRDPELAEAAAAAVELLHCASLVHDDLPCFDDADVRRGRPSVHAAFGEATAVLVGDALIVLAFDVVTRAAERHPLRALKMLQELALAAGHRGGLVAGQAWETETEVSLAVYHVAKTGGLFEAAAACGALASGADPEPFRRVARCLGEAYQIADDLADAVGDASTLGKPTQQDTGNQRPNAFRQLGYHGVLARLDRLERDAHAAVPPHPRREAFCALISAAVRRLVPSEVRVAASAIAV